MNNDESLCRILKRVKRNKVEDEITLAFIEGGVVQLKRIFSEPLIGVDTDLPDSRIRKQLTYEKIAGIIDDNEELKPSKKVTRKAFRCRWENPNDYIADLPSYALYRRHWALRKARDREMLEELKAAPDISTVIRKITRSIIDTALSDDLYRLPLFFANYADADDEIAEVLRDVRGLVIEEWCRVYDYFFEARGVRLRSDFPLEVLAYCLHAIDRGTYILQIEEGGRGSRDSTQLESLFENCVLALFAGVLDSGDGSTIDSAVNEKFRKEE